MAWTEPLTAEHRYESDAKTAEAVTLDARGRVVCRVELGYGPGCVKLGTISDDATGTDEQRTRAWMLALGAGVDFCLARGVKVADLDIDGDMKLLAEVIGPVSVEGRTRLHVPMETLAAWVKGAMQEDGKLRGVTAAQERQMVEGMERIRQRNLGGARGG